MAEVCESLPRHLVYQLRPMESGTNVWSSVVDDLLRHRFITGQLLTLHEHAKVLNHSLLCLHRIQDIQRHLCLQRHLDRASHLREPRSFGFHYNLSTLLQNYRCHYNSAW